MALPYIMEAPDDQRGFLDWLFWHRIDHQDVADALRVAPFNIILPSYPLDLMAGLKDKDWFKAHQSIHNVINDTLGTGGGADLEAVDFTKPKERAAWYDLNFQDHRAWRETLEI